jgi:hypothetical protein
MDMLHVAAEPVGWLIYTARVVRRMPQVELALQAEMSRWRLSLAERGLLLLHPDELRRLATVLDLAPLHTLAEQFAEGHSLSEPK